jgi:hypothetical protein
MVQFVNIGDLIDVFDTMTLELLCTQFGLSSDPFWQHIAGMVFRMSAQEHAGPHL